MYIENGEPADEYDNQRECAMNALSTSGDVAMSRAVETAPSTFATTGNTVGHPLGYLQDAISFDLRLESAMQRLGPKSTFETAGDHGESTVITNEQLSGWRKQHGLKLIGHVVGRDHCMGAFHEVLSKVLTGRSNSGLSYDGTCHLSAGAHSACGQGRSSSNPFLLPDNPPFNSQDVPAI